MRSFIRWMGGKSKLAGEIVKRIPKHHCYCEVFAGGAWTFFEKDRCLSSVEIINDINSELITLYRIIQNHHDAFISCFDKTLCSREEFERLKEMPPHLLTDIQRAVRFFYIIKNCFGGRIQSPTFAVNVKSARRWSIETVSKTLELANERLAKVVIENLPYQKFFPFYDRENTFFYLDPPYYDRENYYGKGIFSKDDFQTLSDTLKTIKGKFLLSINNTPEIREIFDGFFMEDVHTLYTYNNRSTSKTAKELFISNYQKE